MHASFQERLQQLALPLRGVMLGGGEHRAPGATAGSSGAAPSPGSGFIIIRPAGQSLTVMVDEEQYMTNDSHYFEVHHRTDDEFVLLDILITLQQIGFVE